MAKSLQDQLLAAGLTNQKKAKQAAKARKKQDHLQRTGQDNDIDKARQQAADKLQRKALNDRKLNADKDQQARAKEIIAQIRQLITTNAIDLGDGEVKYQFVDGKKVKQLYVNQAIWDRLSRGQLAIIKTQSDPAYAVIPLPVADKIQQRDEANTNTSSFSVIIAQSDDTQLDDDDPYAAYQIPDDLMW